MVRDLARADILNDQGRTDEARAIYTRLAQARADRRQTARRANLRLAQQSLAAKDFAAAERYVQLASAAGAAADIQARARYLGASIAYRREVAAAESELDGVDALVSAGRHDEAVLAAQTLLQRQCPYPPDFPARVKTRIAQIYRAKGDFAQARAMALEARASAQTPNISQGATRLVGEIDAAALVFELRGVITRANELMAAGNPAGAAALLEPVVARPDLPAEIEPTARLRLARAYSESGRFDQAIAVIEPLRTRGALDAEGQAAASRIYLARAGSLQDRRSYAEAEAGYRDVLSWAPPVEPEVRDEARLGLARSLARQGNRQAAAEQVALVRTDPATPRLRERADELLADIQGDIPLNRLVGNIEAGLAYDTNVPTLVSAMDDDGDDVGFPRDQRFDDVHASVAARLQYHHQLGAGDSYLDMSVAALRTFQFDFSELDRSRIDVRVGPAIALPDGSTRLLLGAVYGVEWRGTRFRSSEPGIYAGIRTDLGPNLSGSATYTVGWHNDYREVRDAVDHTLDAQLRFDPGGTDTFRFNLKAVREGAKDATYRTWRLRGGADWTHRWESRSNTTPYLELGGFVERVNYDTVVGDPKRRDTKLRFDAEGGIEISRRWRAGVNYSFYDINSNLPERDRLSGHQVGVKVRYAWN